MERVDQEFREQLNKEKMKFKKDTGKLNAESLVEYLEQKITGMKEVIYLHNRTKKGE